MNQTRKKQSTVVRLFSQLKGQRIRLTVVAVSIIIYIGLSIYNPMYSALVIDHLWQSIQAAWSEGVPFAVTWTNMGRELTQLTVQYFFTWIFYYLQSYLMANVAENLNLELRNQIAGKLNRLPLRFFDQNKAGEILSRVTSDLDKIADVLQTGLLKLLVAIGTIAGSLIVMFYYSVPLTCIFLIFMAVSVVITQIVAKKNLRCAAERQETIGELTGIVEEYYNGRNVIKAYNHEEQSLNGVTAAAEKNRAANQKADFLTNCVNPLIRLLTRLANVVIAIIAGKAMLDGTMTVGVVQAFFQYVNQTAEPLTEASFMVNSLQSALASARRTFELLDEEEEIPDPIYPAVLEQAKGSIAFEHVSFGYDPGRLLMRDISFEAKPGQKIAVVGSTGAGKTTLVNLLMRFYEVNGGRITIDGVDTAEMTRGGLRRNFGMVLQDTWLFGGTVAENIAYSKPDATREEIIAAAKAAKVDYFIRTMPHGYNTVLDNEAANLSAGQRQLLTIARVFLCDPPVIILDEATSSVDTRTEAEIGKAMKKLMKGRTSFVIAHRLSTIRDADMILFMENGNIIEQGNHRELLAKQGAYASLYYSQFE
ncbi:MAG TPA: ABC transporter ATP-binding protein/permease [Candidatus Lachnoclostridium stercorigallinarum]|uniref:ABC transporter ATP-binding protein/permease n=1 Tax=Candidatus Lachnoclostridium stercorigallinarum TaxID=2838634 RepID=A0A9D2GK89_9FIRM|nr:ABC transporter ATP-binding protein/permease [Candidatus Lachnoclostridium stercorigallinarum]